MSALGYRGHTADMCRQTVYSYSVFFILAWFMWAQQIIYHTRFYTVDVYHRVILIIQFMLFGEACMVILSYLSFINLDCWIVG